MHVNVKYDTETFIIELSMSLAIYIYSTIQALMSVVLQAYMYGQRHTSYVAYIGLYLSVSARTARELEEFNPPPPFQFKTHL